MIVLRNVQNGHMYKSCIRWVVKFLIVKPILTDQHIIPEKLLKMKVNYATQIFFQHVSFMINFLSCKCIHFNILWKKFLTEPILLFIAQNIIISDAKDTAVMSFYYKMYDSLNRSFDKIVDGKTYCGAVKKKSPRREL